MITKIREALEVKKELQEAREEIRQVKKAVKELGEQIGELKKPIKAKLDGLENIEEQSKAAEEKVNRAVKELKEEIYEFKVIRGNTQKKILELFEQELHKEITHNLEVLKADTKEFRTAKANMAKLMESISRASEDATRLHDVAKEIRKEDFELTRFHRQLLASNKDKLALMKKIDTLERMIAKMRRGSR